MTTLKELIYKILLDKPETRNSDKKLQWEVLKKLDLIQGYTYDVDQGIVYGRLSITEENFMKAPEFESIRRCRQDLQNLKKQDKSYSYEDKLLIQATPKVKKQRLQLSKEKGYQFIQGQFNPKTKVYEQY